MRTRPQRQSGTQTAEPVWRRPGKATLDDADARGIPRAVSYALLAAPVVLGAVYLWGLGDQGEFRGDRARYQMIAGEDGLFEWGQFAFFLIAAVMSLVVARRLLASGRRAVAALWGLLGLGLIGVAGEEIAWGQRLLGFETPPAWDEVNLQGETTLHNVPILGHVATNVLLALAVAGSVGVVLLTVWGSENLRTRLALLTPPLVLVPLFSVLVLIKVIRVGQALAFGPAGSDLAEYGELSFAMGLAAFAVITARSLTRTPPRGAAQPI